MFGFASGANCPTAQTSAAEAPETDASELSPLSALGLSTALQSVPQDVAVLESALDARPIRSSPAPQAAVPSANVPIPMTRVVVFIVRALSSPDAEERNHRSDVCGVASLLEASEAERVLE